MKDYERLKYMLISDKQFNQENTRKLIEKDLLNLLNNYASILAQSVKLNIDIDSNGIYNISFFASADRLKTFGTIID